MANLKSARRMAGLTQKEVADAIGVTQNCYSYWETGKVKVDKPTLEKLADVFNVSVDFLMGQSLTTYLPKAPNVDTLDNPIKLAVYGEIRAGVPIDTNQSPTDEWVYEDEKYADGNHFALKVVGDSMDRAGITDGCIAIIKGQDFAESGQIVACIVDGNCATLKRYCPQANGTVLLQAESTNPQVQSYVITATDIIGGNCKIIGILREIKRKYI